MKLHFKDGSSAGQIAVTSGLEQSGIDWSPCLARHLRADWGDMDEHDKALNDESYASGGGMHSAYKTPEGEVWIITDADRAVTTILLPEEY